MRKHVHMIILLVILVQACVWFPASTSTSISSSGYQHPDMPVEYTGLKTLFSDDFENHTVGLFPSTEDFFLLEEGRGGSYQCVVELEGGGKALRLWGLETSEAAIAHRVHVDDELFLLIVSMDVYVKEDDTVVVIGFGNASSVSLATASTRNGSGVFLRKGWNWVAVVYNLVDEKIILWVNTLVKHVEAPVNGVVGRIVVKTNNLVIIDNLKIAYVPVEKLKEIWFTQNLGTPVSVISWCPMDHVLYIVTSVGVMYRYFDGIRMGHDIYNQLIVGIEWSPRNDYVLTSHYGTSIILYKKALAGFADVVWEKPIDIPMEGGRAFISSSWAPDGERFVVSASAIVTSIIGIPTSVSKIYIYSVNGSLLWSTDVLYNKDVSYVSWSPKDDLILVHVEDITDEGVLDRIQVITPKGDVVWSKEYPGKYFRDIEWCPDGEKLAIAFGEPFVIQVLSRNGSLLWEAKGFNNIWDIAWSPDGRFLAVTTGDGIYLFSSKGVMLWSTEIEGASVIAWHPSGSEIAVAILDDNSVHIYAINYTAWIDVPDLVVSGKEAVFNLYHTELIKTTLIYIWDFGDATQVSYEPTIGHVYSCYGWLPLDVEIEHAQTRHIIDRVKWWVYVHAPPVPVIEVSPSENIVLGMRVTLNASSSYDPDGKIVSYKWFVNGTEIGTEPVISWEPSNMGVYNISLEVVDDVGLVSRASKVITVKTQALEEQAHEETNTTITQTTNTTRTPGTQVVSNWATMFISILIILFILYGIWRAKDSIRRLLYTILDTIKRQ